MKVVIIIFVFLIVPAQEGFCLPAIGGAPQGVDDLFLPDGSNIRVETWIEGLETPWSLVFLKDGRALVSERPGRIRLIKGRKLLKKPYSVLEVAHIGEGGLMGLAVHPEFPEKPYVYAMHTYKEGGSIYNRAIRLKDSGDSAVLDKVIIDNIPGGRYHNGGRIAFGPDRMLYVTAGETFDSGLAQGLNSLGGKILRITPDGDIPSDNPFKNSPILSYGHRNPQGIAWHPETRELFSSEHGPSGEFLTFGNDEINVIRKGGNYGWPEVIGAIGAVNVFGNKRFIDPLIVWKETTPPSGIAFYKGVRTSDLTGDLFVATLKSKSLIRVKLRRESAGYRVLKIERWFAGRFGRIRDVAEGPDGTLYFMTNNRDGRGSPHNGDDRIYMIVPK